MPTGYTAAIREGISFKDFAMRCARNFGACVMLRDEPLDAPIPEYFEPGIHYANQLANTIKELERLENLSDADAEKEALIEFLDKKELHETYLRNMDDSLAKYEAMLQAVKDWNPPSPDHVDLKKFMIEQIEESINFDCNKEYHLKNQPIKLSAKEWKEGKIAKAKHDIGYYSLEHKKEVERTEQRNLWLKRLRESL